MPLIKTTKEFFEKLKTDEAGMTDANDIWIRVAAEYRYELKADEMEDLYNSAAEMLSDEELGKVSGGTSLICIGTMYATYIVVSSIITYTIHIDD